MSRKLDTKNMAFLHFFLVLYVNQVFIQQDILLLIYYCIQKVQEKQLMLSTKRVAEFRLRHMQYTQRTSYSDGKGVIDQGHITEKLMNKLQKLYGITFEQNVDQIVHQIKVVLAVGAVYFTIALSLIVTTESCHQFCLCIPDSWCNYWQDIMIIRKN